MRDLSVKGVVRRFASPWLQLWLFDEGLSLQKVAIFGGGSVRTALETMARTHVSFTIKECVYKWKVDYEQTWTHIVVRIDLNPDAGISAQTMNVLRNRWEDRIESWWSNVWAAARDGELPCPFTFDVQWTGSGEHYDVRVRNGPGQSNLSTWDTSDPGSTAAHEFGHMLGNDDEYSSSQCPNRSPVNTGSVMDDNSNNIEERHLLRQAIFLGCGLVPW